MDTCKARNIGLALAGMGALGVCILACTSFSPDDKQILYSTFDPKGRSMGVGLYDRAAKKSKLLLASSNVTDQGEDGDPVMLRSQWLPDGKQVVVTWLPQADLKNDVGDMTYAVVSLTEGEPLRLFHQAGVMVMKMLLTPLPMVGTKIFVHAPSNRIVTLDLVTGETQVHSTKQELMLYAAPFPNRLAFVEKHENGQFSCGLLHPDTLAKEWEMEAEEKLDDVGLLGFSPKGRKVAFCVEEDGKPVLVLRDAGQPAKKVPVPHGEGDKLELGQLSFSVDGNSVFIAFLLETETGEGKSLGILEMSTDGKSSRRTLLIRNADLSDDKTLRYVEFGLSHDGTALAASTAYVAAANPKVPAGDCALFIVNLKDSQRAITRVPIPRPADSGVELD